MAAFGVPELRTGFRAELMCEPQVTRPSNEHETFDLLWTLVLAAWLQGMGVTREKLSHVLFGNCKIQSESELRPWGSSRTTLDLGM
jgi:hypothetical protein